MSVVLVNPFLGATGGGGASMFTVTVPAAKLGSADVSNYTVTVAATLNDFKDVAHGGGLATVNSVAFYADAGFTTLLGFERELHNLTTGQVVYHFQTTATLSHTVDTIAGYMQLRELGGNLAVPANAWRATCKRRWGLGDGSTISLVESTGNGTSLTNVSVTAAAGIVNGAGSFNGSSAYFVESTPAAAITSDPFTFTCWAKSSSSSEQVMLAVVKKSGLDEYWFADNGANLRFVGQAAGSPSIVGPTKNTNDSAWHHYAVTMVSSSHLVIYQDGVALTGDLPGSVSPTGLTDTYIGAFQYLTVNLYQPMNGQIAEPRIYSTALSASEIKALYNNFNSPTTFAVLT